MIPGRDDDGPELYEVRLSEVAETELDSFYLRRLKSSVEAAEKWFDEITRAFQSLEHFPHRYARVMSDEPRQADVRQFVHGKGANSSRIVYAIFEGAAEERGLVRILHIRSATQQFGE